MTLITAFHMGSNTLSIAFRQQHRHIRHATHHYSGHIVNSFALTSSSMRADAIQPHRVYSTNPSSEIGSEEGIPLSRSSIFAARLSLLKSKAPISQQSSPFSTSTSQDVASNKTTPMPVPEQATAKERETGAFVKVWPTVYPGDIHYRRAYRKTMKTVTKDKKMKNERNAQRKYAAQLFDQLMKALTIPITESIDIYGPKTFRDKLHPYEATVANLTITARMKAGNYDLQTVISELKALRAMTSRIAKEYASSCKKADHVADIKTLTEEGFAKLENIYQTSRESKALTELMELHKDLRRIPVIDLDIPAIALVGAPNVGKSSIVRAVSTGTPEVNDYPFTTRGVTIGHIVYQPSLYRGLGDDRSGMNRKGDRCKYQVMDTPGLLDRPDEDRNEMERLTFASLAHLPTAVIFVIDPTGLSGEKSTLQAQLNVRNYLKSRFPKRPWLDVVSKGDIDIDPEIAALLPIDSMRISVKTGKNVNELKDVMIDMLERLRLMLEERGRGSNSS